MATVNLALNSIINGRNDFCCLCLSSLFDEPIKVTDVVVVDINNYEADTAVSEILSAVFDEQMCTYINTFNSLCEQCTKSAISSYKFKRTSQQNAEYLTNVLDGIATNFEYTTEFYDSKCLYVSFNIENFTSKQYYDDQRSIATPKAVLRRLKVLENSQNNYVGQKILRHIKKEENSESHKTKKRKSRHYSDIPTSKMLLDMNKHSLKIHKQGHQVTMICPDCGRVYKNKTTYKKHIELNVCGKDTRAHPSDAKYTCDYCNKKYTQKVSLRVHIQYEHGNYKAHICEWCGKKFWAQSRLKAHIVKHTREKNFPCSICGGKFVSKESLLYHTRTHTGEKPYKCPHCDIRFVSASRRSDHVKRQHLGATLECDICHSKFSTRNFLLRHKKTHMRSVSKGDERDRKQVMVKPGIEHQTDSKKTVTESKTNDLWISKVEENSNVEFQKLVSNNEMDLNQLSQQVYEEDGEERKIYLEVSDDTNDNIKIEYLIVC